MLSSLFEIGLHDQTENAIRFVFLFLLYFSSLFFFFFLVFS